MENYMEILITRTERQVVGIDLDEIRSVASWSEMKKKQPDTDLFRLGEILEVPVSGYVSLLRIKRKDRRDCVVACPEVEGVRKFSLDRLLPMPEFVRKRQHPFCVWGFVEDRGAMVMLFTFSNYEGKN